MAPLATGIETVSGKLKRRQPRKLLTRPERGQRRRQIEWPDLMTARRGQRLAFEHARPVQDCCKSIEAGRRFAGLADPSPTIPAGACAGPCIGGAAFAQARDAASPCPSATTAAGSPIGLFVTGHARLSIVEIDFTRIGSGPRAFAIPSDPAR